MPLQRCEGANLESVLEQVRTRFGDTVTIGAFASGGVLIGVNTRDFELPKDGGTQFFTGEETGGFCPHSWSAKVVAEALFAH